MLKNKRDYFTKIATKRNIIILAVLISALTYTARQAYYYRYALLQLELTIGYTEKCIGGEVHCGGLRATNRNLEEYISKLAKPLSTLITNSEDYQRFNSVLWKNVQPNLEAADREFAGFAKILAEAKEVKDAIDENQALEAQKNSELESEYQRLGAPKLLYSCNGNFNLIASRGLSNYNSIYFEARNDCGEDGAFEIISKEK